MKNQDKTEAGNKNKYKNINGKEHGHTEAGQGVSNKDGKEEKVKDEDIRNSKIKKTESQGGVSDSLKGGAR